MNAKTPSALLADAADGVGGTMESLLSSEQLCKPDGRGSAWRSDSDSDGGAVLLLFRGDELAVHVVAVDRSQEDALLAALDRFALARVADARLRRRSELVPVACACAAGGPCRGGSR